MVDGGHRPQPLVRIGPRTERCDSDRKLRCRLLVVRACDPAASDWSGESGSGPHKVRYRDVSTEHGVDWDRKSDGDDCSSLRLLFSSYEGLIDMFTHYYT